MDLHQPDRAQLLRPHCQWFSRLGWALFAQMAAMLAVQLLVAGIVPSVLNHPISRWCLSVGSAYGAGVPAFCLVLRGVPAPGPSARRPMGPLNLGKALVTTLGLVYLSNLLTLLLTQLIGILRGQAVTNPVDSLAGYPTVLNLLLGCVIAPLSEEYLFRYLLLNRLRPYGDKFAILASALCFGLFHGNLNQLFYAFAVGALFAYVVLRTGCLWQSILLHALINFTSVGLVPLLELLGQTGELLTSLLVLGSIVVGMTFLVTSWRDIKLEPGLVPFSEGMKWRLFFENPGVIAFCLLALILMASYVL
ncbi:hypothetical protein B5G06_04190 [Flavonifractor sp. An52]|uniref:CPBP family intramembrane glutamic endopeptidase n=1 Tax=Flavonifractor sp. An52 TaxID=1965642 RepID=UPI000B38A53F|nr:CPBP family intramembrane glutamic endopeptidase [Flavonifractor sp. An52]OUN84885.1 hypothetical protein B5G06_04190 [Flavonifractor sp. An52]